MGNSILGKVVQWLCEGGIRTEPAHPAEKMTLVESPVAAVSLERVDRGNERVTVLVEILGPASVGAVPCQELALDVCEILTQAGGVCCQGLYSFDGRTGMFCVPVTAIFSGIALSDSWEPKIANTVALDGVALPHLVAFLVEQETETGITAQTVWNFTLEEFFPWGVPEPPQSPTTFSILVSSTGLTETFTSCRLTGLQRITEPTGIRQIRKGYSTSRTLGTI